MKTQVQRWLEASQNHGCRDALFYGGLMDIYMNQGKQNAVQTAEIMNKMVAAEGVNLMNNKPDDSDPEAQFCWQVAMNATLRDGVQARDEFHVALVDTMIHRVQTDRVHTS